jgi:hypothetical protein
MSAKAAHPGFHEFEIQQQYALEVFPVGHLADQVGGGRGVGGTLLLQVVEGDPVGTLAVVGEHDHLGGAFPANPPAGRPDAGA